MLRRVPRNLRRAVVAAVLLAVTFSVWQSWSSGTPGVGGWVQTPYGPLGPADRDLLIKVRLAGLWEGPTGQQAEQQALAPAVKAVGGNLASEHGDLDRRVREVADKLGVLLPSAPTSQQMAWMAEISSKTGSDYDRAFTQRLREAHGSVLPVIAEVRASTRNDLVRQFAAEADTFVSRHIQYLESTGLVDYQALPAAPSPGLLSGGRNIGDLIVPTLVFGAAMLGAVGLAVALRNRDAGRRPAPTTPAPPRRRDPVPPLIQIPAPRATDARSRHALRS
jgi:predicted outer membrane protein